MQLVSVKSEVLGQHIKVDPLPSRLVVIMWLHNWSLSSFSSLPPASCASTHVCCVASLIDMWSCAARRYNAVYLLTTHLGAVYLTTRLSLQMQLFRLTTSKRIVESTEGWRRQTTSTRDACTRGRCYVLLSCTSKKAQRVMSEHWLNCLNSVDASCFEMLWKWWCRKQETKTLEMLMGYWDG